MADDITYSGTGASPPANTKQVTDEHATRGHMPLVKLAYSADGDATPITADTNGLEVQLGAALPAGTNNIGDVDVLTLPNVTNAGTFAVQVDGSALTALQLIDDAIYADEAGFTAATSKVMATGLHCVAHGSAPDAAAVDTVVNPIANRDRVPFVIGGHPNVLTLKHANITTAVTDTAIITVATGSKIVVTRLTITLDNASTVFPTVLIGFGATTTPTTTSVLYAHGGFPAGGGQTIGDGSGMLGVGADDQDLRITTTGNATGNGLQITVSYYTVPT